MSKYIYTSIKNNGNQKIMVTKEIDQSKPKCWVEGNHYKFNTWLIKSVILEDKKPKE